MLQMSRSLPNAIYKTNFCQLCSDSVCRTYVAGVFVNHELTKELGEQTRRTL